MRGSSLEAVSATSSLFVRASFLLAKRRFLPVSLASPSTLFYPSPSSQIPYLLLYFYRGFGVGKRRGFQVIASTAQKAAAVREPASASGERCCARDKVCFLERASPFHNHVALTALSGSDGCVEREAFCLVEVSAILLSFAGELRVLVGELLSAC